jgi:hypothetical protein
MSPLESSGESSKETSQLPGFENPGVTVTVSNGRHAVTSRPTRAPNLIFDALVVACGLDPKRLTKTAAGGIGKAAAEIKAAGGTPENIPSAVACYKMKFAGCALTPAAIAKHWPVLNYSQENMNLHPGLRRQLAANDDIPM